MNGVARKNRPSAMITIAETRSSVSRWSLSVEPSFVAPSPRTMKIAEKLATNSSAGTSTRRSEASSISLGLTPETADR